MPIDLMGSTLSKFQVDAITLQAKMLEFTAGVNETLSYGLADGIAGFANSLGTALANGGNVISSIGASLLGTLGGVLVELGKMAIGVGIGIAAIKTALKTLNPAAAIGAGVALIAIGAAFSAGAAKLADSGSSSDASGGGTSSFSGGSSTSYSGSSSSGGTYVFEIQGTKLVGVLANTLKRNKNLGGSLSLT